MLAYSFQLCKVQPWSLNWSLTGLLFIMVHHWQGQNSPLRCYRHFYLAF